jgi:glycosyltransferase involved in cell wall biosynthesis
VVDNNSNDTSATIAQSFDFVTLLTEKRQGVVFARDKGFNAARGEIIGRIDADTQIPSEWIATVKKLFASEDVAAVSGSIHYYDQALWRIGDRIDNFCRRHLARLQSRSNSVFLQGANLAMRRDAWTVVRNSMCHIDGIHEDFDLAIHLQQQGFSVRFETNLLANISSRRADSDIFTFVRYLLVCPRTYAIHHLRSRIYMYPVGFVWVLIFLPSYIGYRGFDAATGGFSFKKLLTSPKIPTRLDPSTIFYE